MVGRAVLLHRHSRQSGSSGLPSNAASASAVILLLWPFIFPPENNRFCYLYEMQPDQYQDACSGRSQRRRLCPAPGGTMVYTVCCKNIRSQQNGRHNEQSRRQYSSRTTPRNFIEPLSWCPAVPLCFQLCLQSRYFAFLFIDRGTRCGLMQISFSANSSLAATSSFAFSRSIFRFGIRPRRTLAR